MSREDSLQIKHIIPDIKVKGRLTKASRIHLGLRDGHPIRSVRADRVANITAQFSRSKLTLNEIAALADGEEVKGASCRTLGIRRDDAQAVLIIQAVSQTIGTGLPESAQRAIQHVFRLTRKRLEEFALR